MRDLSSFLILGALCVSSLPVSAAVVADWKELNTAVTPPTSGLTTDSPTIGDGSAGSANSAWMAGRFGTSGSPVTVNLLVGQTLTVSGSYILTGAANTAGQMRMGIFNDGGQFGAGSGSNWTGGWLFTPDDDLYTARTDGAFVSTAGNASRLSAMKTTAGTFNGDSVTAFNFSMSLTRSSTTTLDIVASLSGGDGGFDQTYSKDGVVTSLFTYTAMGYLIGGSSTADQIVFSGVSYEVVPEPSAFALVILGGLAFLRRRR